MLAFRSPPELTARIDAYAATVGTPRSEAIRQLVENGLALEDPGLRAAFEQAKFSATVRR